MLCLTSYSMAKESKDTTYNFGNNEGYTIHFEKISLLEFIRFVGKVCDVNFVYNENELQFDVSIISEEPVHPNNLTSILIQTLRINGFVLSEEGNNLIIHKNPNVKQIAQVVTDENKDEKLEPIITRIFHIKNSNIESVARIIKSMISTDAILELFNETKLIILSDITTNIKKVEELINAIDSTQTPLEIGYYQIQNNKPEYLIALLRQIVDPLTENNPLILVPQPLSGTIYIVSTERLLNRSLEILENIDAEPNKEKLQVGSERELFIYKPQNLTTSELLKHLQSIEDNLKEHPSIDPSLEGVLQTAREVKETNSIYFMGTATGITKLKEVLALIDVPSKETLLKEGIDRSHFFMYTPKYVDSKELEKTLKDIAHNLQNAELTDSSFLYTINNAKYVDSTDSLLFTGSDDSLSKIQSLISMIDVPSSDLSSIEKLEKSHFFMYHPKYVNINDLSNTLKDIADNLKSADLANVEFMQAINSMKIVESTNSLLFTGSEEALTRIETLLQTIDSPSSDLASTSQQYYLYPLQYTSGATIEDDLDRFAQHLKVQKVKNQKLIDVLEKAKWIKETNSILLTGPTGSVEAAKEIIAKFDIPRKESLVTPKAKFLIYKPKYISAEAIQKSLNDTVSNLEKANLADPNFINAVKSMKYIESTNSLAFTGNEESLEKIEKLISSIDISSIAKIETSGKTTYLIYQIQYSQAQNLMFSLRSISEDLQKSEVADKDFISALNSMRYNQNNNSLIFTGTPDALEKIKSLIEKFDIASEAKITGPEAPTSFFIYKPKYLSGPTLESILKDFAANLKNSGFQNNDIYNAILTLKWNEQTNTLVFTGTDSAIAEIKDLLNTFDVPGKDQASTDLIKEFEQGDDQTSFLVYKLQYHKGDEIKNALKQIATDLGGSQSTVKTELVNAINSIQWIQMTNTLICSGHNKIVERVKELIRSLDVPLKQVFIEILVIETTLTNLLNFGLDWGSKFKYNDTIGGIGNFQPIASGASTPTFTNAMDKVSNTVLPKATDVPFRSGFDLGVIGDIIRHNGKAFLSLGSLVSALQQDEETTVVMTPKILTQDSKTSNIFIGKNLPYQGSVVENTGGASNVTTRSYEYRDVGMKLTLTPFLGNADVISLSIDLDNTSELSGSNDTNGITTSKTSMNTTVTIPNKNFLILSGMVTENKQRAKAGIPCLGGIPWVGAAFSKTIRTDVKDNMVIFIRPHIINSFKDIVTISEQQDILFRENTGSPTLERDYEDAEELIKPLANE